MTYDTDTGLSKESLRGIAYSLETIATCLIIITGLTVISILTTLYHTISF